MTTLTGEQIVELNRDQGKERIGCLLYRAWERANQALWHIPYGVKSIVDVGCGAGHGTILFRVARPGARIVGVECVPERAREARQVCDDVQECFFQQAAIPNETIDVVFSGEVIEHC